MAQAIKSIREPAARYASWKRRSSAGSLKLNSMLLLLLLLSAGADVASALGSLRCS
jgi:hypothetical protein